MATRTRVAGALATACFVGVGALTAGVGAVPAAAEQLPAPTGQYTVATYQVLESTVNASGAPVLRVFPYTTAEAAKADPNLTALGTNAQTATTFDPNVAVLPGDTLIWMGDIGLTQNPSNAGVTSGGQPYKAGVAGLWSVARAYLVSNTTAGPAASVDYLPGTAGQSTDCGDATLANSAPQGVHPSTFWNRWCWGPALFKATLTTALPGAADYVDGAVVMLGTAGSTAVLPNGAIWSITYGGPENPYIGQSPTTSFAYHVVNPQLRVVKQVCAAGMGCDPAADPATLAMIDTPDTAGPWVDASVLPVGATTVQWRITAFNTGNIDLTGVHVQKDALSGDTSTVVSNACAATVLQFGTIAAGGQANQVCTTTLTGKPYSGVLTNSVQLTSTFDETIKAPDQSTTLVSRFPKGVQSNTDDAAATVPIPGLKLTKWVCSTYANGQPTCVVPPTAADLTTLAGIGAQKAGGTYAVKTGAPVGGWVKEATIPYGAKAQWLIVATNIGDVPLANVTVSDAMVSSVAGAGHGASSALSPATWPLLAPGASAAFAFTTAGVTNQGSAKTGTTAAADPATGEPVYATGDDVVNTASATGTAVTPTDSTPLKDETGVQLPPVHSNTSNAEVNTVLYAVGDFVWVDANNDGQQTAGEAVVPGATVHLLNADGTPVMAGTTPVTATTDANGYYVFDKLPAGTYMVQFDLPKGYVWTAANKGAVATDSDAVTAVAGSTSRTSKVFTLGPGAANVVASTDASVPTAYSVVAAWINPTIDAGVVVPVPKIDITKYDTLGGDTVVTGHHPTAADPKKAAADQDVPVSFTITNSGPEPLLDVVVTDTPATGSKALTGLSCTFPDKSTGLTWAGPFAVGASFTCSGVMPGMPYETTHADTATVTAKGQISGKPVTDKDEWHAVTPPPPVPKIDITKYDTLGGDTSTTGRFPSAVGAKQVKAGQPVPVSFTITNSGAEPLLDVVVTDTPAAGSKPLTGLSCTFPDKSTGLTWAGPFAVGASFTCSGVMPAMPSSTAHADTASVTGKGQITGKTVTDKDEWHAVTPPPQNVPTGGTSTSTGSTGAATIVVLLLSAGAAILAYQRRHA